MSVLDLCSFEEGLVTSPYVDLQFRDIRSCARLVGSESEQGVTTSAPGVGACNGRLTRVGLMLLYE